jgi:ribosomal protein S18 acetylase RimI-like enzyme
VNPSDPGPLSGRLRDGRSWIVRPYRRLDRDRVRSICCETGFVGEPQEKVFIGREVFADMFSAYWTDFEPESGFVAEVAGVVEGYALGCLDTRVQVRAFNRRILPRIVLQLASPRWWRHPTNRRWFRALRHSTRAGELSPPMDEILPAYPAHLHTNIADPALRGQGLGGAMMRALFAYLRAHGVPGVHLGTTSHNRQAVPFYFRLGFTILHQNVATIYDHVIPDPPLSIIYMGKRLID